MYVDVHLREGELDPGLREFRVDALVEVELRGPVIRSRHPGADDEVHGAVRELLHGHERVGGARRLRIQDARILTHDAEQDFLAGSGVGAVFHAHGKVDAAYREAAVVDDIAIGQGAVGQNHAAVVDGGQVRAHDGDLGHDAGVTLGLDVVTCLEGLEDHQHQAAGEILHRAAQRHAEGHAARCKQGGEGRGVDAQCAHEHDDQQDGQGHGHETGDERGHRPVGLLALEITLQRVLDPFDQPGADEIQDEGQDDLDAELQGVLTEFLHGAGRIGGQQILELGHGRLGGIRPLDDFVGVNGNCLKDR